jgi:hypothetical protein
MSNNERRGRRLILFATIILMTASVISAVVISKGKKQRERVSTMPPVFSKVRTLEVVNATIVDPNTPAASVVVEIWNNSDKTVMAVDLVSGEGGVTRNGLSDEEHPIVVIQPYGTTKIRMNFGEMTPGAPLVVSAATYADGTEEGDESSLRGMHAKRALDRAQRKAEKEGARP